MFLVAEFISVSVSPREPTTNGIQVCDSHVHVKRIHSPKKKKKKIFQFTVYN